MMSKLHPFQLGVREAGVLTGKEKVNISDKPFRYTFN